jgi:hypothetical protein
MVISDNWANHFRCRGKKSISENDREKLAKIVQTIHKKEYQIRFWNVPSDTHPVRETAWEELLAASGDHQSFSVRIYVS